MTLYLVKDKFSFVPPTSTLGVYTPSVTDSETMPIKDKVESASKIATIIERIGLPIALCLFFVGFFTWQMWWQMSEAKEEKANHRSEMAVIVKQYHEMNNKMVSVVEANTTALRSLETEIKRK